jgi:beta-glucosidase
MKMKKLILILLSTAITAGMLTGCGKTAVPESYADNAKSEIVTSDPEPEAGATSDATEKGFASDTSKYAGQTPEEILKKLTLDQKAAQMVQPACYSVDENGMLTFDYGSILSKA